MPAEVETMAYKASNGVPWHGLGNPVSDNMSIEEMLVAAGLNWKVERRFVRMRFNKESEETMPIPNYLAIVRSTDNTVFQVASDRYKPVQNATIMEQFREYLHNGSMSMDTAGSLKGGGIVWAMANLGKSFTLPGGDKMEGNLLYATSHDGSLPTIAKFVNERVVCHNTLSMALSETGKQFKVRHSTNFGATKQKEAKVAIGLALDRMAQLEEWSHKLAETKVAKAQVLQYIQTLTNPEWFTQVVDKSQAVSNHVQDGGNLLDQILTESSFDCVRAVPNESDLNRVGKAILDSVIDSPGSNLPSAKGTAWGLLNGVTFYTDHLAGRNADNRLTSAWFGERENLKQEALDLALVIANTRN